MSREEGIRTLGCTVGEKQYEIKKSYTMNMKQNKAKKQDKDDDKSQSRTEQHKKDAARAEENKRSRRETIEEARKIAKKVKCGRTQTVVTSLMQGLRTRVITA